MTKHERWFKNMVRNGQPIKPSEGNPGVIKGILTNNSNPRLPSMQAWRRAVAKNLRKPGPVKVTKG